MAVDHVKSTYVTNLDAGTANTSGRGAPGPMREVSAWATAVTSSSVASTYQLCRLPSNCKVKSIMFESAAQTAGAFDLGVYYATDGTGNKPTSLVAADAVNQTLFATAINCATAVTIQEVVNESTVYTIDKRNQPLWQAAGLSSDPGGFFDLVATVTTQVTTGAGTFGVSVRFEE